MDHAEVNWIFNSCCCYTKNPPGGNLITANGEKNSKLELLPLSIFETIQNEPTASETIHSVPLFPFSSVRKQSVSQITKAIFQRCWPWHWCYATCYPRLDTLLQFEEVQVWCSMLQRKRWEQGKSSNWYI